MDWIDIRVQEPPLDKPVIFFLPGSPMWIGLNHDKNVTHWMPLPDPPHSMITLKISKKFVREWVRMTEKYGDELDRSSELYLACRKALEEGKG